MMTEQRLAAHILSFRQINRSVLDSLYGHGMRYARQSIMTSLTGKPARLSDCGITAVRLALLDHYDVSPDVCLAEQDRLLDSAVEEARRG